jgi:integrative and conjugative element protein (TIGR02256 family)
MTAGQSLALEQLRAIAESADGSLEVLDVADAAYGSSSIQVELLLDCSEKQTTVSGVQLKRKELFVVVIPSDFPYDRPATSTRHTRFAGLPHVQFMRHLCLYQAPNTEWNVDDGMFGYIERLNIWLDHASTGQLNPSGEALHPPVAYPASDTPRTIIPRADTPPVTKDNWVGLAKLGTLTETRADIVGWAELAEVVENIEVAPAFLVAHAMPYEFPTRMGTLFSELEKRGVSIPLMIAVLRYAVLVNRETDPLFVILGTPMRGIAGKDQRKFHLAAWYISPTIVRGLRLSLYRFDTNPRLQQVGEEVEKLIVDFLTAAPVEWCQVREDRPEIVVLRDKGSAISWFKGKAVSIWGCGAIGSHVAEFLVRAGVRKLVLRDEGLVTPGILVRQLFSEIDIGRPKVDALSEKLKAIRPNIEIEAYTYDLLHRPLGLDDWTDSSDAVIETTGSASVLSKHEAARRRCAKRTSFISMALGHTAQKAMLLLSATGYTGGALDIDRKLRQSCYRNPDLRDFTEEFWPSEPRTQIFQPEPGCSDATFVGSCSDVASLAATMLNLAAQELTAEDEPAVAYLIAQPSRLISSSKLLKRFSWPADRLVEDPTSGYQVRIAQSAWSETTGWIAANNRERGIGVETGGLLLGQRNDLLKIIWIDEASGPPPDSSFSSNGFVCGIRGTRELALEKTKRTKGLLGFVGMWHTHPGGVPVPSDTDIQAIEQLVDATRTKRGKSLILIVGGKDRRYTVASYVFSVDDFKKIRAGEYTRVCSLHFETNPSPKRNIGLALSGGGSRAIAFHLGCLRALHDRGILNRLQVVSSVSGGSVIAAMYSYTHGSFEEFDQSVVKLLKQGFQGDIARRMARPLAAAKGIGTLAIATSTALITDIARVALQSGSSVVGMKNKRVLSSIQRMQPPFPRWMSLTVAFEEVLRERVLGSLPLAAPRRDQIDIVLNACELRSGSSFRFGSRESGCWRYGTIDSNATSVAHAVAASAAYPAILPAIDEVMEFTDRHGQMQKRRVLLTDGGIYDNLGVTCLEPGSSASLGYNHFSPDYIICCDAGHGVFQDFPVPFLWGPRMVRSFQSVFRKAQNATQNRLHSLAAASQIRGFLLAYLGQIDHRLPYAPVDLVGREEVYEYPTDFSPMCIEDINRISKRGEQITRTLVTYYCPEL